MAAVGAVLCGGAGSVPAGATAPDRDVTTAVESQEVDWERIERDAYTVKYAPGNESDAETIDDHVQYAREVVGEAFPHELSEPITVGLYPNEEYGRSQFAMGYYSNAREIAMMTPSDHTRHDADGVWYKKNTVHEYVHVPQSDARAAGDDRLFVPNWFKEGHAEYVSVYRTTEAIRENFESYRAHERIVDQVRNGDGYLQTVTARQYAGGKLIFRYLDDEYGMVQVADVFDGSSADNFTQAVESGLGISPIELHAEWLQWAGENLGGTYDERLCAAGDAEEPDDTGRSDEPDERGDTGGRRCGGIVTESGAVDLQGVLRAVEAYNNGERVLPE